MLEVLLGFPLIAPRQIHHGICRGVVSRVRNYAGRVKCRDVALGLLTVLFTTHHDRVPESLYGCDKEWIAASSVLALAALKVGCVLVEVRPLRSAVDRGTVYQSRYLTSTYECEARHDEMWKAVGARRHSKDTLAYSRCKPEEVMKQDKGPDLVMSSIAPLA